MPGSYERSQLFILQRKTSHKTSVLYHWVTCLTTAFSSGHSQLPEGVSEAAVQFSRVGSLSVCVCVCLCVCVEQANYVVFDILQTQFSQNDWQLWIRTIYYTALLFWLPRERTLRSVVCEEHSESETQVSVICWFWCQINEQHSTLLQ